MIVDFFLKMLDCSCIIVTAKSYKFGDVSQVVFNSQIFSAFDKKKILHSNLWKIDKLQLKQINLTVSVASRVYSSQVMIYSRIVPAICQDGR